MARNTPTQNLLEEEGRIDAEKAYTSKGKVDIKAERKRVVHEIKDEKQWKAAHTFLKS
jgi:hypothetical protein